MLQVNLLDKASRRGGRKVAMAAPKPGGGGSASAPDSPIGAIVIALVALAMLGAAGALGYHSYSQIADARHKLEDVRGLHDQLVAEREAKLREAEAVRRALDVQENQLAALHSLDPPDRILWAEKLNMLANLIPPDVYLDEVEIMEHVEMVETEASKAAREKWRRSTSKTKGKEPEVVLRPIVRYTMRLTGLAMGRDNVEQYNNVLNFHKAVVNYETIDGGGTRRGFMEGFLPNIEFEYVEASTYPNPRDPAIAALRLPYDISEPVNRFTFKLTTRAFGNEPRPLPEVPDRHVAAAR